jgi:RimJ/RimL family protein N-acetyltransferase
MRPLVPDDVTERYCGWLDEEQAHRFIVGASAPHDIASLRAYVAEKSRRADILFLGIFTREFNEHIGNIKYEPIDLKECYAVMGILIGESAWRGRGVAAEVIRTSGLWLRDQLGIRAIMLGVSRSHKSAIKAYEAIGFRPESTDKIPSNSVDTLAMVWHLERTPEPDRDSCRRIS